MITLSLGLSTTTFFPAFLYTKGIVSLLIKVLSSRTPEEILSADLYFIDKIGLRQNLSPTRSNGLLSMVRQIKLYALAYQAQSNH